MSVIERHSPLSVGLQRNDALQRWINPSGQDPLGELKENFNKFNESLAETETLFVEHVYENPDFSLLDARNHQFVLHYYLFRAGHLAANFVALDRPEETTTYVLFLDAQIKRLEKVWQEWHGDPGADRDIPDSFKQAMHEVETGQTSPMEEDLFAADAATEAEV